LAYQIIFITIAKIFIFLNMVKNYKNIIAQIKCTSLELAQEKSLPIYNNENMKLGVLVPVGPWILDHPDKIESICAWRQNAMKMFLAQFESTYERSINYLKNLSIAQEDRIFFLIFDDRERFIGHIGLSNIDGTQGELDNLMRGVPGGNPRIIFFSELALLSWAFNELGLEESNLRVLSINWTVIGLHESVGYSIKNRFYLMKTEQNGIISHNVISNNVGNVPYQCIEMRITKDTFFQRHLCLRQPPPR